MMCKLPYSIPTLSSVCEKQTSIAWYIGSGLNSESHWKSNLLIVSKSLLSWKLE